MKAGIYLGKKRLRSGKQNLYSSICGTIGIAAAVALKYFWNGQGDGVRSFGLSFEAGSRAGV